MKLREAAQRVLAEYDNDSVGFKLFGALEDLRAALAEPVQEPLVVEEIVGHTCECVDDGTFNMSCAVSFARAIERAHGIGGKNGK